MCLQPDPNPHPPVRLRPVQCAHLYPLPVHCGIVLLLRAQLLTIQTVFATPALIFCAQGSVSVGDVLQNAPSRPDAQANCCICKTYCDVATVKKRKNLNRFHEHQKRNRSGQWVLLQAGGHICIVHCAMMIIEQYLNLYSSICVVEPTAAITGDIKTGMFGY